MGKLGSRIPGRFGPGLTKVLEEQVTLYPHLPERTAPAPDVPVFAGSKATTVAEKAALAKRFPQSIESIRTMLRDQEVVRLPAKRVRGLVAFVGSLLGPRRIASLDLAELDQLQQALRTKFVTDSSSMKTVMTLARARAKAMRGASAGQLTTTPVHMTDGVWVFVHTRSPDPVILAEAFAPFVQGSILPRPAFPGSGKPRWLPTGATTPVPDPPALPTTAPHLVGPAKKLLGKGPSTIIGQLFTAELRVSGKGWRPLGPQVVRYFGKVPAKVRKTLGLGIHSITYDVAPRGAVGYDTVVILEGRGRPMPDRFDIMYVLPEPKDAFGPGSKMERCSLAVPGDRTPAGQAYGSEEFNQLQERTIERYLRRLKPDQYTITGYLQHRPTRAGMQPFVRTVEYQWREHDVSYTVTIGVDKAERTFGPLVESRPTY